MAIWNGLVAVERAGEGVGARKGVGGAAEDAGAATGRATVSYQNNDRVGYQDSSGKSQGSVASVSYSSPPPSTHFAHKLPQFVGQFEC